MSRIASAQNQSMSRTEAARSSDKVATPWASMNRATCESRVQGLSSGRQMKSDFIVDDDLGRRGGRPSRNERRTWRARLRACQAENNPRFAYDLGPSQHLHTQRQPFTAADANRRQAALQVPFAQCRQECHDNPGAAAADGMPKGNRAAPDIHLCVGYI